MEKIFAVWKTKGPTSHDIVEKVRKLTGEKKVGHAGTLDPFAEGVLVIGVGREATKKLKEVVKKDKEYMAVIELGAESDTDDATGNIRVSETPKAVELLKIEQVLGKFKGVISQTPPRYSAIKIKGKPAYKLARQGEEVVIQPRRVEIKSIEVLEYKWPFLKLKIVTGPGVYIRSLARDIGRALGVGGYLKELIRTRVGEFTKEKCKSI